MTIQNHIITIKGKDTRRWLVLEAVSIEAAYHSINHARVTGSIGDKVVISKAEEIDGRFRISAEKVQANVILEGKAK